MRKGSSLLHNRAMARKGKAEERQRRKWERRQRRKAAKPTDRQAQPDMRP